MGKSKLELCVFVLLFGLLAVFLIHNFDSIGQDIGRHLKTGEIIWQTKEIPKTNLFSFTEPDHRFINHHWLSEAILFKFFNWFGFTGLILIKVFLVLIAFGFLFAVVKKRVPHEVSPALRGPKDSRDGLLRTGQAGFWPLFVSFLLAIFIFISRTEVRPEIFSFAILSFFLFVLFKAKYSEPSPSVSYEAGPLRSDFKNPQGRTFNYLWFLPIAQLFWVNLHIYFFIGPMIYLFFLVDRIVNKKINPKQYQNSKQFKLFGFRIWDLFRVSNFEFLIFSLILLATLINPAGIQGALLPLNILKEYGYSIVENQTLAFLADFFGFNLSIFTFKFSAAILVASFVLTVKKTRQRIFEILVSTFFIYAGFRMLRNLPLYALASFPILAMALTDAFDFLNNKLFRKLSALSYGGVTDKVFKILICVVLILMIFLVAINRYYHFAHLSKVFGFSIPNGLERAVNFVKENQIKGPMFNNFDIGGYLIWKLYPDERVFVDNRPEAYSVKFFSEIYKPMQQDKAKWLEFSEKYSLNFIFFGHADAAPWAEDFLKIIAKDPSWKMIYLNEDVIILVKNSKQNSEIISRLAISEANAIEKVSGYLQNFNENKTNFALILSRVFYNFNWLKPALYFSEEAIKTDPQNRYAYLNKGLVHAYYMDMENQKLAAESIKKAIDLGLNDSQYFYILGVIHMNLGRLEEAKTLFIKALEIDKNNEQAKEFLNKYFVK